METKANYVRVGLFTLIVLAMSFGFVYWSVFSTEGNSRIPLIVRIEGSVTGLQQGSQVLFNGLPVGSVRALRIDPNNPRVVIANTEVDPGIPIRESTQANIGFQGLTGFAFIELQGGQANDRDILETARAQGTVPVIQANPSDVTDILATARDIAERANNIIGEFEGLVGAVGPSVRTTAENVARTSDNIETFTASLAANADGIDTFLASLSQLATTANAVAQDLPATIDSAQSILEAVDPEAIRSTVVNVAAVSQNIRTQSEGITDVVEAVRTAATSFGAIGTVISNNTAGVERFLTNLGPLSDTATSVAGRLDTTLGTAQEIVAAVDPEAIGNTVGQLSNFATAIGSQSEAVQGALTGASNAARNVEQLTASLATNSEAIDQFLAGIGPVSETADQALSSLITTLNSANGVVSAIEPEQISTTLQGVASAASNIAAVAEGIGEQSEAIDAAIQGASGAAQNIAAVTANLAASNEPITQFIANLVPTSENARLAAARLNNTLISAGNVVDAIDPEQIASTLEGVSSAASNISQLAGSIGSQSEAIEAGIRNAAGAAQNVSEITATVNANRESISNLLTSLGPITDNVSQASVSLNDAAAEAERLVSAIDADTINSAVNDVSGITSALNAKTGEIQSIIDGVDTTVRTLDTALTGFNGTRAQLDQILAGIDPAKVNAAVDNVSAATANVANAADSIAGVANNVGERGDDIDAIITNVQTTTERLSAASQRVDNLISSVDGLLAGGGEGNGLGSEVSSTLLAIRQTASSIQSQITPIAQNLERFSGQGLREVQGLVQQVTRSVDQIEGAVTDFADDPSQVLYGGEEGVKQYDGRTRR